MYVYIISTMDLDLIGNIQATMCHLQHKSLITSQGIYMDPPKTFLLVMCQAGPQALSPLSLAHSSPSQA